MFCGPTEQQQWQNKNKTPVKPTWRTKCKHLYRSRLSHLWVRKLERRYQWWWDTKKLRPIKGKKRSNDTSRNTIQARNGSIVANTCLKTSNYDNPSLPTSVMNMPPQTPNFRIIYRTSRCCWITHWVSFSLEIISYKDTSNSLLLTYLIHPNTLK